MKQKRLKNRFPWRQGNHFRLLVDGKDFLGAMLRCIREARHYLLLEMYLVESGRVADEFIGALSDARQRGVKVYVLLDDFGSRGLCRRDRQRLIGAGVSLAFYNPLGFTRGYRNLFRDHRKLLLADGKIAFTGGTGINDRFDPGVDPYGYWHETMVEMRGPVVADWQELFVKNWARWGMGDIGLPEPAFKEISGGSAGRLTVQRNGPGRSDIMRSFLTHIRASRERVWLATAYFLPPRKLLRALRRSARRGVDTRLLLPGPLSDHPGVRYLSGRSYARLLRSGVRIYEFQPRFIHAKVLLCDDWVSIGSSNADRWNYHWNLEANQEIEASPIIGEVVRLFEGDFDKCQEFDPESWSRRPFFRRLQEVIWGWLGKQASRFSRGKENEEP